MPIDDDIEVQSIDTIQRTITAYNTIRANCFQQIQQGDLSHQIEHELIQTMWECDATIASLKAAIKRLQNHGKSFFE